MTSKQSQNQGSTRGKPFGSDHRGKPGRAKGTKNMKTIVKAFAEETRTVSKNGTRVKRSNVELLIKALIARTIDGDVTAIKYLERLRAKLEPSEISYGYLVVPETMRHEQLVRYIEYHNARVEQPDQSKDL